MNLQNYIDIAMEKDASDIHLIAGNKPMLRIMRDLIPIEEAKILTPEDMNEIYDELVKGNLDKDEVFNNTRKLEIPREHFMQRWAR